MNIFISYSSKNRQLVELLAADLISLGENVWFDKKLTGGHVWWDEILTSIERCDLFIFVLTPQSLDSYPCKLEYSYAAALHKHILPVVMSEDVKFNLLPPELSELQVVDYRDHRNKQSTVDLIRALRNLPAPLPAPDPLPLRPAVPISPLGSLGQRVDAESLTVAEQKALLFDLKSFLENSQTYESARSLIERFHQRDDLNARVGEEIVEILAQTSHPVRHSGRIFAGGLLIAGLAFAVILIGIIIANRAGSSGNAAKPTDVAMGNVTTTPLFVATQTVPASLPVDVPTVQAMPTSTAIRVAASATRISLPTQTDTLIPSNTLMPTRTDTPTASNTPQPTMTPTLNADFYYQRGATKAENHDYAGAISDFTEVIRLDPYYRYAYTYRCAAQEWNGNPQGAIDDCNEALRLDSQDYTAYFNRCEAKTDIDDYDGAIADCTEALRINPQRAEAYTSRCIAKSLSEKWRIG